MTDIEKAHGVIENLTSENADLRSRLDAANGQIANLQYEVAYLRKQMFGRKTETRKVILSDGTEVTEIDLFNEAEAEAMPNAPELEAATPVKGHVRRKKQKLSKEELLKTIPHEKEVIDAPENDRHCEKHPGAEMKPLGEKLIRTEVRYIPAKVVAVDIYQKSYQCPVCHDEDHFNVMKAPVPAPILDNSSIVSASLLAAVIHQKYEQAVPLYRQEKEWRAIGLPLTRATMANWIIAASKYYFSLLAGHMRKILIEEDVLHADETYIQVHKEKGKGNATKSYMWCYCSSPLGARHAIRLFQYEKGRKGAYAEEFLKGFDGILVRDQFAGYNQVTGVRHAGCWAHLRRYFVNAIPPGMKVRPESLAGQAIAKIDEIFAIERELKQASIDERQKQRQEREKPLVDAFFAWAESSRSSAVPKSKIGAALNYALSARKTFYTYLDDGRVSMSNATAENAIRPFVIGRKNWMFSDSPRGAAASAAIYSLVETCKANNLDPAKYFEAILTRMPGEPFRQRPELLDEYMPWSKEMQGNC